jgi:hypothetical protein
VWTERTGGLARGVLLLVLAGLLAGCSTTSRADLMRSHIGVRPDEPKPKSRVGCAEYEEYLSYTQQLQEAYHSRASQNRWWIYVAAITGIGAAAASGALAAATAVSVGTLALLSISGGFAAGTFGALDNTDLAKLYTSAANAIDQARLDSERLAPGGDDAACHRALVALKERIVEVRTTLELGRTNTAAGALIRAKAEREALDKVLRDFEQPRAGPSP